MRRLCTISLLFLLAVTACDRKTAEKAPAKPAEETEPTEEPASQPESQKTSSFEPPPTTAPPLPETIESIELTRESPMTFKKVKSETVPLLEAPDGQLVCLEKVLAAHSRLLVRLAENCDPATDSKIGLYDLDGKRLAEFDRLIDYSEPLAALLVQQGKKQAFVELATGKTTATPSKTGSAMYVFVQNRPEVMVFDHPEGKRDMFAFSIVEGLPTEPVAVSRVERRVADHGTLEWNEARKLYEYRDLQTDCWRAAFEANSDESARCESRILRGRLTGKRTHWTDHWLTIAGGDGETLLAQNIYTKEERDIAEGVCERRPRPVRTDLELDVPRLLFGCVPDREKPLELDLHLWSPERTIAIGGGPWVPGRAFGRWIQLEHPTDDDAWLDIVSGKLAEPSLDLAAKHAAVLQHDRGTEVFRLDPDSGEVTSLGNVECKSHMRFVVDQPDMLVAICGDRTAPKQADQCPGRAQVTHVEESYAWDLKSGKRWSSVSPILDVTKDGFVVAETDRVQGLFPCRTRKLGRVGPE